MLLPYYGVTYLTTLASALAQVAATKLKKDFVGLCRETRPALAALRHAALQCVRPRRRCRCAGCLHRLLRCWPRIPAPTVRLSWPHPALCRRQERGGAGCAAVVYSAGTGGRPSCSQFFAAALLASAFPAGSLLHELLCVLKLGAASRPGASAVVDVLLSRPSMPSTPSVPSAPCRTPASC